MIRTLCLLIFLFSSFSSSAFADEEYWEYTFRPGDSLWNIAKEYTTSVNNWKEIERINNIRRGTDRRIQPGTRVVIPVSMLKLQPTPAVVIAVSGKVLLTRKNGEQSTVVVDDKLYIGDRVNTEAKQSVRLQFADKSELQVLSHSEVELDKLSYYKNNGMVDTRVRLNSGSVNTWVEKQTEDSIYQIITPAAITAVRGTAFRLSATDGNISRTEVTEGTVAVSAGQSKKDVKEGFGIVAEKDKPLPEPVKLLPAPELTVSESSDHRQIKAEWKALEGAAFYRYQLATDSDFNDVVKELKTTETLHFFDDLDTGKYYFKVRGIDQLALEGLDSVVEFDKQEYVPPPVVEDDQTVWVVIVSTVLLLLLF